MTQYNVWLQCDVGWHNTMFDIMWCRMTQYNVWLQCDVGWHNTMFDYNVMWDDTIQCLIIMWCRMTQYNVWL